MLHTVNLTETEELALRYASVSNDEWIQNVVQNRCRIAIDEILDIAIKKCLEEKVQIPGSTEEIVSLAFEKKWVISAAERHNRDLAAIQAEYQGK